VHSAHCDRNSTLGAGVALHLSGTGLFPMLDEEIFVPRASDETYLSKVQSAHGKHDNFVRTPASKLKVPPGRRAARLLVEALARGESTGFGFCCCWW